MKKIKLFDAVFASVCIVLTVDTIATAASIGNSQYFWWLFLMITFFIPYALITAELGATLPKEEGMYGWIKRGINNKWATRAAWYYWVNFPLWMSALAILIGEVLTKSLGFKIDNIWLFLIQISYIWIVTVLGYSRIGQNKYIVNIGAFIKLIIMLGLGILGIYTAFYVGAGNVITISSLIPDIGDLQGLGFICVIICNFMGFEIISTFAKDLDDPQKQIPKAILTGGILISIAYLLPLFAVNIAIPLQDLQKTTGLMDSYFVLLNNLALSNEVIKNIMYVVGFSLIYTLFANIISWSFGVSSIVGHAGADGNLPKMLSKTNKLGVHYMVPTINAIVATIVIAISYVLPNNINDIFWTFFAFNIVTFIMSYIPIFPAYINIRKKNLDKKVLFRINASNRVLKIMTVLAQFVLIAAIIFALIPEFNWLTIKSQLPLIIGVVIALIIGELFVYFLK